MTTNRSLIIDVVLAALDHEPLDGSPLECVDDVLEAASTGLELTHAVAASTHHDERLDRPCGEGLQEPSPSTVELSHVTRNLLAAMRRNVSRLGEHHSRSSWPRNANCPVPRSCDRGTGQLQNVASASDYSTRIPEMARAITSCWISLVPSKIVWFTVSKFAKCRQRSTGALSWCVARAQ